MENDTNKIKISTPLPCVVVFENVFDPKNFIDLIEEESQKDWPYLLWEHSATGNSENTSFSNYRSSYSMSLSSLGNSEIKEEHPMHELQSVWLNIWQSIDSCIHEYRAMHDLPLSIGEGCQVLKYSNGGEYKTHCDDAPDIKRTLSMVAWLNDDYEGGELQFTHFNEKIKGKKGGLILFPSNYAYTHYAHPVGEHNSDIKYVIVTWLR